MLPVTTEHKERLSSSHAITLTYEGRDVAMLKEIEFYTHRKEERCARQFGTTNGNHPYIKVRTVLLGSLNETCVFHKTLL